MFVFSSVTDDVEHFIMCLLAIYSYALEECLIKFFCLCFSWVVCIFVAVLSVLYMAWILDLYQIKDLQIFSPIL